MVNKIERVWGVADQHDLELTKTIENEWQTSLPLDLSDGWYATILYAEDTKGKIGSWHGILYVADGFSHLHITEEKFSFWLLPERQTIINLKPERFELVLRKECDYHGS